MDVYWRSQHEISSPSVPILSRQWRITSMASRSLPPACIIPFPTPCSPVRLVLGIRVGARPKCTLRTTGGRLMMDGAWHGITAPRQDRQDRQAFSTLGHHAAPNIHAMASLCRVGLRSRAGAKLGHRLLGPPACWSLVHGHSWLETPGNRGDKAGSRPISEAKQLWRGNGEAHMILFSALLSFSSQHNPQIRLDGCTAALLIFFS